MHLRKLFIVVLWFAIYSCSTASKIEHRYTPDDKFVFELVERLRTNPKDDEAAKLLPDAYNQASETRKNINASNFNNLNPGDRWMEIAKELSVCQKMYDEIISVPAAQKAMPNPWNPSAKIQEARLTAAKEYYNQGLGYMSYNNRTYAKKAYEYFVKANEAYPNYADVQAQMARARELSVIRVLVRPVNYYSYGWDYWGFSNDYLQYKIVSDLNNSSFSDTRFYTESDIRFQHFAADKVVDLRVNDLNIGRLYSDSYTINRQKQIVVGESKSLPAKPIYQTVTAVVSVRRSVMQSRASLECRIYDQATNRNAFFDRFPDNYTWTYESAKFKGDERALEPSDRILINNPPNPRPPSRQEIARRLIDNCYFQLISSIRNSVRFME
jgi:tetratricopeptide (TPR) repeat protein